ncbi:MAG: hypothetical protein JKY95_17115 [Planctomycetaceae bacterium]|nr:hypothetical protein [Planctomycetaceae bacterium]
MLNYTMLVHLLRVRFCLFCLAWLMSCGLAETATFAESFVVREPVNDSRSFQVTMQVHAKGTLKTPSREKKPTDLPLEVQASMKYTERRLPSAGRENRAWRSFRVYTQAASKVVVKEQTTTLQLSPQVRELIAEGKRSGLILYNEITPLKRSDLDLLTIPGDPLCLLPILPSQDVEVGETWAIPQWAAQMFVGIEAAVSSKLTGKLLSVSDGIAKLQITGEVSGATAGAEIIVVLNGTGSFDLKSQTLTAFKLIQQEKRSISAVSPGMDVTATIQWTRNVLPETQGIPDAPIAEIPLDPPALSGLLQLQSKHWNIRLMHDRNWHLFQEIPTVTVMRLVESGSLLSQCNIAKIQSAGPGRHVSPEQFENDIRTSLGDQVSEIIDAGEVPSENENYIYRVIAAGTATELEMVWVYYLCASPQGKQVSFVFAVERSNLEALNDRDLAMVLSLKFLPEKSAPTP